MNRISLIFLGVFGILAFSFTGLVLTNQISYGALTPHLDENEGKVFPQGIPGIAARGQLVYQDLGCVYCHTQQVRRPDFGADKARGWGDRQSVAREYIREHRVLIGDQRIGPDLRNIGIRSAKESRDANWYYRYLYSPRSVVPHTIQPPYPFLFESRKIVGQASPKALKGADFEVAPGHELVPTERAESLVAYLLSLGDSYAYPEASNVYTPPEEKTAEAEKEGKK